MTQEEKPKKTWQTPEVALISTPRGGSHTGTHEAYFVGSKFTGGGLYKFFPKTGFKSALESHTLNYFYS